LDISNVSTVIGTRELEWHRQSHYAAIGRISSAAKKCCWQVSA